MPRPISPAMRAHLDGEVLTLTRLVEITRRHDGLRIGWTTSDQPVIYDGLEFRPIDHVSASSTSQSEGSGVDNLEFRGAFTDDRVTEVDIRAGLWRGASVIDRVVNRLDLAAGELFADWYTVADIEVGDHEFRFELESLEALLKQEVGDRTTPGCTCQKLGDARCKFAFGTVGGVASRVTRTVSAVVSRLEFRVSGDSAPVGFYSLGLVRCLAGANAGLERQCKVHRVISGVCEIELRIPFPFVVGVGDSMRLEVGCDRTHSRCIELGNANNFHGQPYLPGNDLLVKVVRVE